MSDNKYKLNDVVYFVHGSYVVKGKIDELITHYTQKETIIKYIIRPYGLDKFVTIDASQVYSNLQEAKDVVLKEISTKYTKERILENYEKAKVTIDKKVKSDLENVDIVVKKSIEQIEKATDKYYDELEDAYQKSLKEKETKDGTV